MALSAEVLDVKGADGPMATFVYGHHDSQKRPAVIVIQEIFGVNRNTQDIAQRFRDDGYVTAAPDLFYRGGRLVQVAYADAQRGMGLRQGIPDDGLVKDLQAVVDYLKSRPDVQGDRIAITGYCFGGRVAFLAAMRVKGIGAAAVHYGGGVARVPNAPPGTPTLLDSAKDVACPIIGLFGNTDQNPSPEDVNKMEAELKRLGKTFEPHRYDGAGHGFMCDDRQSYNAPAAQDAWTKTTAFFRKHIGVPVAAG